MASRGQIQTARADFLDASLYEDAGAVGLPTISRQALLVSLSRAFDLAEGRRGGHAQRVAYVATCLAARAGLGEADTEDAFHAALLHDIGMARPMPSSAPSNTRGRGDSQPADDPWHCEAGAEMAVALGFSEAVSEAVRTHHQRWDRGGDSPVAQVVAVADRVESLLETSGPPLVARRHGPQLLRAMGGVEIAPQMAAEMASIAAADDFWLGLYDRDLSSTLVSLMPGEALAHDELREFVAVLSDLVDQRNGRQAGRGRRIGRLASELARANGLSAERAQLVELAALLQDIGTLGVPAHILSKPDILTVEEMAAVQTHPVHARDILSEAPGLGAVAWWVGCHHERIDGKGYPGMLEGDEVPLEAQLIGMSEAFIALISERPYRRAMELEQALEVMLGLAGTRFEPSVVERLEAVVAA